MKKKKEKKTKTIQELDREKLEKNFLKKKKGKIKLMSDIEKVKKIKRSNWCRF